MNGRADVTNISGLAFRAPTEDVSVVDLAIRLVNGVKYFEVVEVAKSAAATSYKVCTPSPILTYQILTRILNTGYPLLHRRSHRLHGLHRRIRLIRFRR
jgi:hypothetical protein